MRQILETWSVTRKNFGILVSSVRLQREVPGQTVVVMAMLVIIMFFMLICMLTMLVIRVLVVKGTYPQKTAERVCSC